MLPLFPDASVHFQELLLLIALASILYGSAMAFTQTDARLDRSASRRSPSSASSPSGSSRCAPAGAQGALLQMVNHGRRGRAAVLRSSALLAARAGGSEDIRDMGGIAFRAPVLAALFLIVAFANLAMPGSANFVGEFCILLGVFQAKLVIAIVAFTGVVLASVYTLRVFIRAMHNRVGPRGWSRAICRSATGWCIAPLVLVILALALYPQLRWRARSATSERRSDRRS